MRFELTSDDHIGKITEDLQPEADGHGTTFEMEQELSELAGAWTMTLYRPDLFHGNMQSQPASSMWLRTESQ